MQHFLTAKQHLLPTISFSDFQTHLHPQLTDESLLSLLLASAIEHQLQPFADYAALLFKQGASVNFSQFASNIDLTGEQINLFMLACRKSNPSIVEILIVHPSLQPYARDQEGKNALHHAIMNQDRTTSQILVKILLKKFPSFKTMGNYPKGNYLSLAIVEQNHQAFKRLIKSGIRWDYRSLKGSSVYRDIMIQHKTHRNLSQTMSFIKVVLSASFKEGNKLTNAQQYLTYARQKTILSQQDIQSLDRSIIEYWQELIDNHSGGNILSENDSDEGYESEEDSQNQYQPNHEEISQQMYKYALETQQAHNHTWQILLPFYSQLLALVNEFYCVIEVIGSFASHLWIPGSDIDFLLILPDNNSNEMFEQLVDIIYQRIKRMNCYISIKLLRMYKLPMIKLVLNKEFEGLEIEIFMSGKKSIASKYVAYTNEVHTYYPEIRVIYYVLRRFLGLKELHDHKKGGLKAYAIFLLIYSMRSQYHYQHISQFLEHFAYYYGLGYDYIGELSTEGEVQYKINIIDPLNSDNNMGGKKTNILALREFFRKIYYAINTNNEGSKLQYIVQVIKEF